MVKLENKPDVPGPPAGQLPFGHLRDLVVPDPDIALARLVQAGDQIEKSGLARAAGSHEAQELALLHLQTEVLQDVHLLAAPPALLMYSHHLHYGFRCHENSLLVMSLVLRT